MRRLLLEKQAVTVSSSCFQWNLRDDIAFLSDAALEEITLLISLGLYL